MERDFEMCNRRKRLSVQLEGERFLRVHFGGVGLFYPEIFLPVPAHQNLENGEYELHLCLSLEQSYFQLTVLRVCIHKFEFSAQVRSVEYGDLRCPVGISVHQDFDERKILEKKKEYGGERMAAFAKQQF